ncbi:hypothetical protein [Mesoflavibacter zeaxanthinifaciens]|uniref:hypothetical protein n=1 Tax=Mesoflavibacter zeaxanthinifaciens TaxID=393060 RepID=UPI003A900330
MKLKIILIFIGMVFMIGCKSEVEQSENKTVASYYTPKLNPDRENINVSILLDLSDRIDSEKYPNPTMDYYLRDAGYIRSIAEAFEIHVRSKRSNLINDKIKLFIDPEPTKKGLDKRLDLLRINFDRNNAKREAILQTSIKYDSISKLIYEDAIADNNYVGSDIWGFIKNRAKDYCIEKGKRNILVILTDGYIYHKDNLRLEDGKSSYLTQQLIKKFGLNNGDWRESMNSKDYSFIVPEINLSDIEILVLGINSHEIRPYGDDIITEYWKDWLSALNVGKFAIKQTGLPVNLDKTIKEFILDEKL